MLLFFNIFKNESFLIECELHLRCIFQPNLNHWCKPEDCEINSTGDILSVKEHLKPIVLQCPYSFTGPSKQNV